MIPCSFNGKEALATVRNGRLAVQIGGKRLRIELRSITHVSDRELRVNEEETLSTQYLCQLYAEFATGAQIKMSGEQISISNTLDVVRCRINGSQSQLVLKAYSLGCGGETLYFDQISDVLSRPPYRLAFKSARKWEIVFESSADLEHVERFLRAQQGSLSARAGSPQAGAAPRQLSATRGWFLKTLSAYLAESAIEPVKRRLVHANSQHSDSDDEFADLASQGTESKPRTTRQSFPCEVASDVLERAEAALAEDLGQRYHEECKPQLDAFRAYFGKVDQDAISRDIIRYAESVFSACATSGTSSSAYEDASEASTASHETSNCEPSSSSSLVEAEQPSASAARTFRTKAMCPPVMKFASGAEKQYEKRKKQVDITQFI